jgi:mannose/fructose/sorbose-specific phosphotransferase system IIA component
MRGYLLISHGTYATALKSSLAMITGELDSVFAIGLEPSDGPESFGAKMDAQLAHMAAYAEIIVFTDLLGGSPGNAAVTKFMADPRVHIVAGMNFPMLLNTVLSEGIAIDAVVQSGKDGIVDVKAFIQASSSDVDE